MLTILSRKQWRTEPHWIHAHTEVVLTSWWAQWLDSNL